MDWFPVGTDDLVAWQAEVERLNAIVQSIDALRREEGDCVVINCDNPDFDGPNSAVEAHGDWCTHAGVTFYGASLAEALLRAAEARKAAEAERAGE